MFYYCDLQLAAEVVKLQKHLALLREEYVKLQNKHTELERKYNLLNSIAGTNKIDVNSDSYITRLLRTIADLFDKDLYSDLCQCFLFNIYVIVKYFYNLAVKLDGRTLKAHRFVLDARSKNWASFDLSQISELDLSSNLNGNLCSPIFFNWMFFVCFCFCSMQILAMKLATIW